MRSAASWIIGLVDVAGLVADAVRHTKGPAALRVHWAAGVLRIGAWDTGPAPPDAPLPFERSADLGLEDGRGPALVRAYSDLWGRQPLSRDGNKGKLVWCEPGAA
ncbi:ATP-binding protein [Streptomyces sp. NPDC005009]